MFVQNDGALNWEDSVGQCQLYGGWLVDIRDIYEHNCLVEYAMTNGIDQGAYWTDGDLYYVYFC